MIEEATQDEEQQPTTPPKPRKPRAPKPAEPKVEEVTAQRLGIELDDSVSTEIDALCAANKFFQRSAVRAIIREEARIAANEAVAGKVKDIMRRKAFGGAE